MGRNWFYVYFNDPSKKDNSNSNIEAPLDEDDDERYPHDESFHFRNNLKYNKGDQMVYASNHYMMICQKLIMARINYRDLL